MSQFFAHHSVSRRVISVLSWVVIVLSIWTSVFAGRLPAAWGPTVERTLYFKLPIEGTRFHWQFSDAEAFLAGELTLRIINTDRDEPLVVFRDGVVHEPWQAIESDRLQDGEIYFGFVTDERFRTAPSDSLIITLTVVTDLDGRGPNQRGVLRAGTYSMTGTYSALYGGTWNPINSLVVMGKPPAAYLQCWDGVWPIEVQAGSPPPRENAVLRFADWVLERGADGRRCGSHI